MTWTQKIKRGFWSFFLYPIFPYVEHLFVFIHKRTRQRFHVGWLAPETTLEAMKEHLSKKYGFGNHFIAWEDQGQVLSWRKLDGFDYQFHLRVFADGEIRGHYEKTPEASPLNHFLERGERSCNKALLTFLGPHVTKHRYIQNPPLTRTLKKDAEITFVPEEK